MRKRKSYKTFTWALIAIVFLMCWIGAEQKATRLAHDTTADTYSPVYDLTGPSEGEEDTTALHDAAIATTQPPNATKTYVGKFSTYGYDLCKACTGKSPSNKGFGITAGGDAAVVGVTVAADWDVLPYGTKIYIEGIGERIVQDRGHGINGTVLDILVEDHAAAYRITGYREVWIVE